MLALGTKAFRLILDGYWKATPPQMYASLEAEAFAAHLAALDLGVPHVAELLRFEQAVTATLNDGQSRVVAFDVEPLPLLRALAAGRLPAEPPRPGRYEIELAADGPAAATGLDITDVQAPFPYHQGRPVRCRSGKGDARRRAYERAFQWLVWQESAGPRRAFRARAPRVSGRVSGSVVSRTFPAVP